MSYSILYILTELLLVKLTKAKPLKNTHKLLLKKISIANKNLISLIKLKYSPKVNFNTWRQADRELEDERLNLWKFSRDLPNWDVTTEIKDMLMIYLNFSKYRFELIHILVTQEEDLNFWEKYITKIKIKLIGLPISQIEKKLIPNVT